MDGKRMQIDALEEQAGTAITDMFIGTGLLTKIERDGEIDFDSLTDDQMVAAKSAINFFRARSYTKLADVCAEGGE